MRIARGVTLVLAVVAGLAAWPSRIVAAPARVRVAACTSEARQAAQLLQQAKLREAEDWLHRCAQARCAVGVRRTCSARLAQLSSDIPTVVPVVTDERGQSLTNVPVMMDGRLLAEHADGRALPVDPGEHEFTFTAPSGKELKQKTVILQGQRNRVLALSLAPERAPAPVPVSVPEASPKDAPQARIDREPSDDPPRRSAGHPVAPLVLTGLGLAGLTSFGVLTTWGRRDDQILVKNCSPDCNPASVDHIRDLYLGAKISLGVGLAALAGATMLFISNGGADEREATARPPRRYVLDLRPTDSGAVAGVAGTF